VRQPESVKLVLIRRPGGARLSGIWGSPIVVSQPERGGDSPEATLEIPTEWLMPWLDLDAVREAQRSDTVATMTGEYLRLSGVELVVERRWLREAYWRQIKQAITRGYIYKSSAVQVTLRGERREHERRNSAGLPKAS
jgi:hypothetical protein